MFDDEIVGSAPWRISEVSYLRLWMFSGTCHVDLGSAVDSKNIKLT